MAEISDYVVGPYEGVSQAPPPVRLPGACEVMEDCIATIPNGVQKRPPLTWTNQLKRLDGSPIPADPSARWTRIRRGSRAADMTLLLNREAGTIQVYLFQTSTMTPVAVTLDGNALTYLRSNAPIPMQDLRACTIEDVTFITNRTVTVVDGTATETTRPFEAMIWVETGQYGRTYSVAVTPNGGTTVSAAYITPNGGSATEAPDIDTAIIAGVLYNQMAFGSMVMAAFTGNPLNTLVSQGFTVTVSGSVIYLSHPTNDFVITTSDGQGGLAMTAIKVEVERFSDLPALAVDGFIIRIAQESTGALSDYYVQFVASSATTIGVWKEVPAPGVNLGIDPATMPIGLTDTAGVWELKQLPWTGRTTGDVQLSPDPEFLNDQITDVGWWKGRLALIANGSAELSASDSPYKYYSTTLATALDSDHIGMLPPTEDKAFFKEAVIFDARFIIFGDECQGIVQSSTGIITPSTTGMFSLSDSSYTDQLPVQASNHKIYFGALRGDPATSCVVFEIAIDRLSGLALAEDLTPAVPNYLPATLNLAATLKTDYITIYASQSTGRAIVHAFRHSEQQRVQNAWYAWNLPVGWLWVGIYMDGTLLRACISDPSGNLHAMAMDLTPDRVDPSGSMLTYLDGRLTEAEATAVYNTGSDTTTFTLPLPVTFALVAACRAPAGTDYPEGYLPPIVGNSPTTITLGGDWRAIPLWFGYPIDSYFVPSQFYKLGQDGKPEHTGDLTIQQIKADVAAFGYLQVTVTQPGVVDQVTTFEGYDLDNSDTPIDSPPIRKTAVLEFGVNGDANTTKITFSSSNHRGFKLLGFEWKASFTPTAQRVT